MTKHTNLLRSEKGQSIVIVALVMVALLAMTGLAMDGGNMYLHRRRAQNAADGAALAGTRILALAMCAKPGSDDAAINAAVQQYAQLNGVTDLSGLNATYVDVTDGYKGDVGAGTIPVGTSGVAVTVERGVTTYLLRVVGISEASVSAAATAMTGPPESMGGLRPIGIPWDVYISAGRCDYKNLEADILFNFGNCPNGCMVEYTKDGEDDIYRHQHRGYLNLAWAWKANEFAARGNWPRAKDPNSNANNLKDWMENGYNGSQFYVDAFWGNPTSKFGDFIHAKPGRQSSVIGAAPVGEEIVIPIFDYVAEYNEVNEPYRHFDGVLYQNSKPDPASQGGGFYYHIVGFTRFLVMAANQGGGTIAGCIPPDTSVTGFGRTSADPILKAGYGQVNACQHTLQAINLVH